jgi:hypothetical protein
MPDASTAQSVVFHAATEFEKVNATQPGRDAQIT